jgi:methylmalonyl-CoA/ethylmalonyl-CoA epimerase
MTLAGNSRGPYSLIGTAAAFLGRRFTMLQRIDHIGVIVDDLAEARRFLERLGMALERTVERPEMDLRAAFYRCGDGSMIEVIEMTSPEGRNQRLGEGNQARIEHIAVEVADISEAMTALRGLGIDFDSEAPIPVGRNLNLWSRPESSDGVRYQFLQKNAVGAETAR